MITKGIIIEDFVNYKKPCLTIMCPYCNFKCDKECGKPVCQNSSLASAANIEFDDYAIIKQCQENQIIEAICFQGLEPLDSFKELCSFLYMLQDVYKCNKDIVIYTGYTENEIQDKIEILKKFKNIIIKFGRFIPNQESHFDEVLGVKLASPNQYARRIS